ncbi:UNVERIFIED_CONTAM: U-box domain-containing protein 28 [Sesamum radiatum]|uniref:U-box domain-containing protein n=1 Tax=Sesamum radiatum TaxID=300843 RepID=A0AAW2PY85_SESRA
MSGDHADSASTHTTPNLTLRRLIHLWLAHAEVSQASPSSSSAISKQQAVDIINGEFDSDSLAKLIGFVTASEVNLKFVALSNAAVTRFVEVLAKSDEIRICEVIVEILDLISTENGIRERLNELILKSDDGRDCLSSFAMVLQKGSTESSLSTAGTDTSAVEAGLSALLAISTSRPVKKELIRLGIVRAVGKILSGYDYSSAVRRVIEKGLAMLETVATCTEGGGDSEDGECVVEIVRRLMKCSGVATEHGITVLWSVCCLARDPSAQEKVAKVNGLTKVLLVMQSDCSGSTRQMCGELVKVLRAKSTKSNLAPYETRTTHITPY